MEAKLLENHKRYLERMNFYKDFGYDVEEERKFIIEKACPLYGDILEVGTGKGYFTIELAKERYNFTSIDISDEEQGFARLNIKYFGFEKYVDFRIENAEGLSFKDCSFDIIFSINTMHHLIHPIKAIDELIRIVSFEGKIVLSDFNKAGLEVVDKIHASEGRKHEASQTNLSELATYLKSKGFNVQKDKTAFHNIIIVYQQTI